MSRIHEALKRAQKERTSHTTPSESSSAPPERKIEPQLANESSSESTAPNLDFLPFNAREEFLRFEDLWTECSMRNWAIDNKLSMFSNLKVPTPAAEQFRTLRSRLYQLRENQPLRTILVTSAMSAEGKTFVTSNLALAMARQQERRILLIDSDLRCPRLHSVVGAPLEPGLADYLRGDADERSIIQRSELTNFCFIPGGRPGLDASELVSNGRLKALLGRISPLFDWVIIDSPPCVPVADAGLLADLCDGVILVVRAGLTPSATVQKASQELRGKNVVGVVLNGGESLEKYADYYYYTNGEGDGQLAPGV